jgi:hypothetical protein
MFPREATDALHAEFAARYGDLDRSGMDAMSDQPPPNPIQKVGDGRFEIALRMTGGFGQPSLFANAVLINFLMPILGRNIMRLGSVTAVASFPGAELQHTHRDNPQLLEESPGSTETRCRITSGGGDPRDSATEMTPPKTRRSGKGEMVR